MGATKADRVKSKMSTNPTELSSVVRIWPKNMRYLWLILGGRLDCNPSSFDEDNTFKGYVNMPEGIKSLSSVEIENSFAVPYNLRSQGKHRRKFTQPVV